MKLGIMQPYFLPYIGYWQLLNAVDKYVIYDDVNFIKGGWINRNRILQNGAPAYLNVPMVGASSFKRINEIQVNRDPRVMGKLLKTVEQNYRKAPCFEAVMPLVESICGFEGDILSEFLANSLRIVCAYLGIETQLLVSSQLEKDESLRAQAKVIDICRRLKATEYFNAIGGQALYDAASFAAQGIRLRFLKTEAIVYAQGKGAFVPNLSILDVLMFNACSEVKSFLNCFELVGENKPLINNGISGGG